MTTARSDDDTWDTATSLEATAVMVAVARAAETRRPDPLIRDEYAELLALTPELEPVRKIVASWWAPDNAAYDRKFAAGLQHLVDYQAVRTHFFDEFLATASAAGVRQHVILAAGLDARAYRLDWPDASIVYELDLPMVLEYKVSRLQACGASPSAIRRSVPVDLRADWPKALRDHGFAESQPTAWLAEGLLPFLSGRVQAELFGGIDDLSAPGSQIALEEFGSDGRAKQHLHRNWAAVQAERRRRGQIVHPDPFALWYDDDGRPQCVRWFDQHGWLTLSVDANSEARRVGRAAQHRDRDGDDRPALNSFVTATKCPA
jgi:methyltransferase (TIGR00027 family)